MSWQWVDNTGHILSDGTFFPRGQSVTTSVLAEVDYGVTERFAATAGVPFIFARYTGGLPPFSGLDRDTCRCWHSLIPGSLDRGTLPFRRRVLGPHAPRTIGHADTRLSVPRRGGGRAQPASVAVRHHGRVAARADCRRRASRPATPTRSSRNPFPTTGANRSNVSASVGYALTRSLFVHGGALYQKMHGGLTAFEIFSTAPPDERAQGDRLLKMRYWHLIGGVSYSAGFADLFFSVEPYVWGRDTHDGIAYSVGSTWYFDFSRRTP